METVDAECDSCHGTGLYSGMCEGPGVAVVCLTCDGTGCMKITYKPFERRLGKKGIKFVHRSGGKFILGPIGPQGNAITYRDFAAGLMPPK